MLSLITAAYAYTDDSLFNLFSNPPAECRTKLWWFHGETETTKEGIKKDLEEFKDKGIGGVVFYDQVHGNAPDAAPSMSPQWWEMLKYAALTAKELGIGFEVAVGNGYVSGGPWITPDLAMKKTVFIDTLINLRDSREISLTHDINNFHDVASVAFKSHFINFEGLLNYSFT